MDKKSYLKRDGFIEKVRPLTYYEIVTGKPLNVPIPNSKYIFHSRLQSWPIVVRVHEMLRLAIEPMIIKMGEPAQKTAVQEAKFSLDSSKLIQGVVNIARILWEFADQPKWFWSRNKMWRAFLKACVNDADYMWGLVDAFRTYNKRVFFLTKYHLDYPLMQAEKWKAMDFTNLSGVMETTEERIKRRGLLFSPSERLKRQAQSARMN